LLRKCYKFTLALGRIGVRGKWTILGGYGQVWEPYVRVNLWQDWGGTSDDDVWD
jgi:hypothetical protein